MTFLGLRIPGRIDNAGESPKTMYVCVCVWERETGRERIREEKRFFKNNRRNTQRKTCSKESRHVMQPCGNHAMVLLSHWHCRRSFSCSLSPAHRKHTLLLIFLFIEIPYQYNTKMISFASCSSWLSICQGSLKELRNWWAVFCCQDGDYWRMWFWPNPVWQLFWNINLFRTSHNATKKKKENEEMSKNRIRSAKLGVKWFNCVWVRGSSLRLGLRVDYYVERHNIDWIIWCYYSRKAQSKSVGSGS